MTVSVCKLVRNAGQEMKFERILPLLKKKKKKSMLTIASVYSKLMIFSIFRNVHF